MSAAVEIRERRREDLDGVRGLLAGAGLPLETLEQTRGWVALADGELAGHVALEQTEAGAVLRSLVVAAEARGRGVGGTLLRRAEAEATANTIFLRTQTIGEWVAQLGYERVALDAVPAEVRATVEFAGSICTSVPVYRKLQTVTGEQVRRG
ncbi:MAG: GNAT family N-acetyltransferase [Terracidiphilus sp.]|nr:GNAT family N-acetyltransferase [Terracidiphilus sp.]